MLRKPFLFSESLISEDIHRLLSLSKQSLTDTFSTFPSLLFPLSFAILAGWGLEKLNVPVGWLLGSLGVGMLYSLLHNNPQPLPASAGVMGQAIIAMTAATRFSVDTLILAQHYAFPLLLCILVTGSLSVLNGYLLHRWANIEKSTSFLGSIPGAGLTIVAMSEEMGADPITVAVLQYLRILLVAFIIPSVVGIFFPLDPNSLEAVAFLPTTPPHLPLTATLLILYLCGIGGIWVGRWLKLPSALFLGPFLMSLLVFWGLPVSVTMPHSVFMTGLLLLGLSTGVKFNRKVAKKLLKAVILEICLVISLIIACFGIGYGFHLLTQVDTMTAILGSTPGGISAMMATAIELGGNTGLVMAMQMTRMLLILLLIPWLGKTLTVKAE